MHSTIVQQANTLTTNIAPATSQRHGEIAEAEAKKQTAGGKQEPGEAG